MIDFKGMQFPKAVILHGVFFHVRYAVPHRDIEGIRAERGVTVDHATLNRWVVKFSPLMTTNAPSRKRTWAKPCNFSSAMKHRSRLPEQDDPLRPRLVDMIDHRHELVTLAALIGWEVFDREWAGFFSVRQGSARDRAAPGSGIET